MAVPNNPVENITEIGKCSEQKLNNIGSNSQSDLVTLDEEKVIVRYQSIKKKIPKANLDDISTNASIQNDVEKTFNGHHPFQDQNITFAIQEKVKQPCVEMPERLSSINHTPPIQRPIVVLPPKATVRPGLSINFGSEALPNHYNSSFYGVPNGPFDSHHLDSMENIAESNRDVSIIHRPGSNFINSKQISAAPPGLVFSQKKSANIASSASSSSGRTVYNTKMNNASQFLDHTQYQNYNNSDYIRHSMTSSNDQFQNTELDAHNFPSPYINHWMHYSENHASENYEFQESNFTSPQYQQIPQAFTNHLSIYNSFDETGKPALFNRDNDKTVLLKRQIFGNTYSRE